MTKALKDAKIIVSGGAPARRLGAIFGTHLSVRQFGAVGNGIADDTDALQNTFYAAWGTFENEHGETQRYLNKPVYIPSGRYRVTRPLFISDMQYGWLYGDGSEASVLVYDGPIGTVMPVLSASTVSNPELGGNSINSITVTTPGTGFPPNHPYLIVFPETGIIDRAKGLVISNEDGTITDASVILTYGGAYTSSTPAVSVNTCTPLLRFNGARFSQIEGIGLEMTAAVFNPNSTDRTTACMIFDRWVLSKGEANRIHQDVWNDISTRGSTFGIIIPFFGDTGVQYGATANDTLTISTGAKTLHTTYSFGGIHFGMRLRIMATGGGLNYYTTDNYMEGLVTSFSGSPNYTINITIDKVSGSGTFSSWGIRQSPYAGFSPLGSEHLFTNLKCSDHDHSGIQLVSANALSQNVYGGTFTNIGNVDRATNNPNDFFAGGAAINVNSGSVSIIDGVTFVNSKNADYLGEGAVGLGIFSNIVSTQNGANYGNYTKGPFLGRFPAACVLKNVRYTNLDHGTGQKFGIFYENGTVFDGCTIGYGQADIRTAPFYSRASSYLTANPFNSPGNSVLEFI